MRDLVERLSISCREVAAIAPRTKPAKAYLNWARTFYERWRRTSVVRARPLMLTVDPNNICHLRCPLCPTGYRVLDRPKGHADVAMFRDLVDELGDYLFFVDFYNWGEPLISPRLPELVALADARGIVTNLSTNLSLRLDDARIEALLRSGLGSLTCSIDGATQETYATYRRRGKLPLVLDNLRRIVAMRDTLGLARPLVTWQFVVFRFNEHERASAEAMAREIGVDRLHFISPHLSQDRFPLRAEDSAAVAGWAPSDPAFNRLLASHPDQVARQRRHRRCDWHYVSAAINWDGSVAPCCSTFEVADDFGRLDYDAGRTYMAEINGERFRAVRDRFAGRITQPLDLVCEHCPTPLEMDYATRVNRRILRIVVTQALLRAGRLLGLRPGRRRLVVVANG
jgi:MoaA/NifB/PqqE/SkfB family radical SAM enzyme